MSMTRLESSYFTLVNIYVNITQTTLDEYAYSDYRAITTLCKYYVYKLKRPILYKYFINKKTNKYTIILCCVSEHFTVWPPCL